MIKKASFRELQHYSRNDILHSIDLPIKIGEDIIARLVRSNILKIRSESPGIVAEELQSSDIVVGDVEISNSDKRYVFDYVGLIELNVGENNIIINCFPKYIKRSERELNLNDMRLFVRAIERYNNAQQFTITISSDADEIIQYNPLAIVIFLLRDYWEHGLYTNEKEILESNGNGEIDWESTINQNIPLLRNGRPFYVEYYTAVSTTDESDYITRLHEYLLTKYSRHLRETTIDQLFDIETVDLYDCNQIDFGNQEYIEQRILKEINVQFVTRKQILLRAMYALIHKTGNSEELPDLSLYGTNSFHKIWETVCAEVFCSQLKLPIKHLPLTLKDSYKNESRSLLEIIPFPQWRHYESCKTQQASGTLIPDYISVCNAGNSTFFVILDAKYYDIKFHPKLSGQPGVDDIDKQYLYQLAYSDFIEQHNLVPINAFLCPCDEKSSSVAGEVEMAIFAKTGLKKIKVVLLSCERMLQAFLSDRKIDIQRELPDLFFAEKECKSSNIVNAVSLSGE